LAALAIISMVLSACGQQTPTAAPAATMTPAPMESSTATATRGAIPTQRPSTTPSSTSAPSVTPGPSPTSTPLPPLSAHTWQPQAVLIQAARRETNTRSLFSLNPFFVLYADGTLILQRCSGSECSLASRQLTIPETCQLLNSIDQLGFFDYNPGSFQSPQSGGTSVVIEVNAWRSLTIELDNLEQWIENPDWLNRQHECSRCMPSPTLLPALVHTYQLLNRYQPGETQAYTADRLAVSVSQPWLSGTAEAWMEQDITLNELNEASRCPDPAQSQTVILTGLRARRLAEYISSAAERLAAPIFSQDLLELQIETRWLLPLESAPGCGESSNSLPSISAPTPAFLLSCQPSDGILKIPTATNIPRRIITP
jgi:hypothetical protein